MLTLPHSHPHTHSHSHSRILMHTLPHSRPHIQSHVPPSTGVCVWWGWGGEDHPPPCAQRVRRAADTPHHHRGHGHTQGRIRGVRGRDCVGMSGEDGRNVRGWREWWENREWVSRENGGNRENERMISKRRVERMWEREDTDGEWRWVAKEMLEEWWNEWNSVCQRGEERMKRCVRWCVLMIVYLHRTMRLRW